MGRRNKGRGSSKKKRGGKSKQQSSPKNNNDGEPPHNTTSTPAPNLSELRLIVGDRVDCHLGDDIWASGTVVMRNLEIIEEDGDGELKIAPYRIRLDDGNSIYAPVDTDDCIKRSSTLAVNMNLFKLGSRVECLRTGGTWCPGTVIDRYPNWFEDDPIGSAPLYIHFDSLPINTHEFFWGPGDSIKLSTMEPIMVAELRFDVGDRVECSVGDRQNVRKWLPGTIIKTHYKEPTFGDGFSAPYQIRLDMGNLIYAPADEDCTIRKFDSPAPTCWICFDDQQTVDNPIVRECACRGEENGYVHIDCLAKLAITKATNNENYKEGIDDENPFTQCITCKQEFKKGSYSFSAIARKCMDTYGGSENLGGPYFGFATSMFGHTFHSVNKQEDFLMKRCIMITDLQSRTSQLDLDLSRFLGDLAVVYEVKGWLDRMKEALDESLHWIEALEKGTHSRRKINILSSLAKHAYLVGNKNDALDRFEKCIALTRPQAKENDMLLATLLLKSGNLELELGNTERGIEQMSESMDIMTVVYGRDHVVVSKMIDRVSKIREGEIEVMPKALMGLDFSSLPAE